jgi:hypothetical protein
LVQKDPWDRTVLLFSPDLKKPVIWGFFGSFTRGSPKQSPKSKIGHDHMLYFGLGYRFVYLGSDFVLK